MGHAVALEDVFDLVKQLPARDKVRLIAWMAPESTRAVARAHSAPKVALGAVGRLGPAPSAEEIDQVRREEWADFPREDIDVARHC